ncbi:MAG: enoyl-CoA hydratase/isomerase family protein [Desulfarculaceae bacterium]|nr:enoyl-CoA hydratase/isomerase family protein [Desulfarculaceae bacterium]
MAGPPILYRVEDQIAWISINQPEKMNRLDFANMRELARCVDKADQDPGVRVIVISGEGGKAFCAGGDIGDFGAESVLAGKENLQGYADLCLVFNRITTPSIAMISGYALAGGCGLAMLPHLSIATYDSVFGVPEIKIGVWPMMVMAILFRTVGRKKGLELICTGERIDAREALRIGMINQVTSRGELLETTLALANQLKGLSRSIMSLGLEAFNHIGDLEYTKAISYLRNMVVLLSETTDSIEGRKAFFEKRKPVWKD